MRTKYLLKWTLWAKNIIVGSGRLDVCRFNQIFFSVLQTR